ncbi:Putative N(4)-(Beta-N-acetylglucosaminyl)-L-asparaginase [[Torrubiella] hemipterigena]|uniref:Putative N(4)-(Beta-N-acetylglucosaminyl)-L-asparaginase n=1 Tax=[Torrubiella] hemipterigena TaxID=1531966 RepID=A0A0A1T1Z5_9HYPO|nr:Putative N(4)-(Beta-N-acetylglucosaminyl)-L-asparaginase [[Torrubiella] hemipterigena]
MRTKSKQQQRLLLLLLTARATVSATETLDTATVDEPLWPLAINTWAGPFQAATDAAYLALKDSSSALDAVEIGCSTCERNRCDGTVGFGGSPDENCETTLDAMIMDGVTMKSGAVAGLRRIKDAISVARHVLEHTSHTLLVGDHATEFAVQNGFTPQDLSTPESRAKCQEWKQAKCQPNYRLQVSPAASTSCGPYKPLQKQDQQSPVDQGQASHDTISLIAIDDDGVMAAGTSTNGASHKIPGRVGDGPITGSGTYVDGDVGACGSTGDGDIMMRFLPCYQAVESMRRGMTPQEAADDAIRRILKKYPKMSAGIVVVDKQGRHAGASAGFEGYSYAYRGGDMKKTKEVKIKPIKSLQGEPTELRLQGVL